jgi:cyclophilin family peptidyl-prolyl cis-trans isomerase
VSRSRRVRLLLAIGIVALPAAAPAQSSALTAADSALVGRILLAEDRRDSTDDALRTGSSHQDVRVRLIAQRALGRIRDPRFAARDSLPPLSPPRTWPEPAWRLRYRALAAQRNDCGVLRAALADSAWPVRLRAADLAPSTCSGDDALAATLRAWIDALPTDASRRAPGGVSWHAAAHAVVALARLRPDEARVRTTRLATHGQWQVRMYAARAAALLSDTTTLRTLARDASDDVAEAAIDALSKLTGHSDDDVYLAALTSRGAQAVRASAIALKGSPRQDVRTAASSAFDRWAARGNASERDARVALLEAAGRPGTDDRPPAQRYELPPNAVALALGGELFLRVTMAPASGGGRFEVRLRGDVAPMMAARVFALAKSGYYDNGNWHRVEHDFVIQGAGPGSNEYVGLSQFLRDELGTVPHTRGTVGMSTRGHDTGDAQWFVNLKDNLRLGRDYTVFAEVIDGIDVVDGIMEGDVVARMVEVRPVAPPRTPEGGSVRAPQLGAAPQACAASGWRKAGQLTLGTIGAWAGGIIPYAMIDDIDAPDRRVKGDAGYQPNANTAFAIGSWVGGTLGVFLAGERGCGSFARTAVGVGIPSLVLLLGRDEPYLPLLGVVIVAPLQGLSGTLMYRKR